MPRRLLITGAAEDQSPQKHAVYNDLQGYPSGLTWEIRIETLRISQEEFFENLFFSVERNGGNSYFYPKVEDDQTLCRYEWHFPWRNRAAQIRLGIMFNVRRGSEPKVGQAYLGTNEGYKERGSPNNPAKISQKKLSEFQEFVASEVFKANSHVLSKHYKVGNLSFTQKALLLFGKSHLWHLMEEFWCYPLRQTRGG